MFFLNNKKYLIPGAELVLVLKKKICNEYYKACPKFIQDRVQKYSLFETNAQIKGFFSAEPVVQPSDGKVWTFPEIISNHMKNKTVIMNSQHEFMEGKSRYQPSTREWLAG